MRPNLALLTALSALVTQSCGVVHRDHDDAAGSGSQLAGSPGESGSGGSSSDGGSSSGGSGSGGTGVVIIGDPEVGGRSPNADCTDDALFENQVVDISQIGSQRVFYSWTTSEQVAELRAGGELFSRSERPGMGRGVLFTELAAYAEPGLDDAEKLANLLGTELFAKARFAWTNPWATVLGFPGENYGDQLLRIELKPDAWIAVFDESGLSVLDAENEQLPWETVMASPERIGAIYHVSSAVDITVRCGTFVQGGAEFREFALGNLQMV
ncbi:MAG TPA: hypothetical protein VEQ59_24500, partial [Polyangiaceae bacterium]|nr:hypothetical protein [Polyangiaceae bacterium]